CPSRGCAHHTDKEKLYAKRESSHAPTLDGASEAQSTNLSSGRALSLTTRALMESRLGYDFSGVRIHDDAHAAQSARAINALAYTNGQNIVFGAGQFSPQTRAGQQLLAHELTHVVQQRAGAK